MPQNPRHERILDLVRQRGFVSIEALAEHFAVTPQTIRRDINALCGHDLLRRYHGGAGLPSSVENTAYQTRQILHLAEKRRIAALVASHIPDEASLFINIGTTTEEVARALMRDHRNLRVITNNLHVASMLAPRQDFEVIVAGGVVRGTDHAVTGEATVDFIGQFKVDYGIIGISGIDADGALLDFDYREVRVSQTIIANSRRVFLAADHSKFGRNAMVRLGSLKDLDAFFTDAPPPPAVVELLAASGVRLCVADPAAGGARDSVSEAAPAMAG